MSKRELKYISRILFPDSKLPVCPHADQAKRRREQASIINSRVQNKERERKKIFSI